MKNSWNNLPTKRCAILAEELHSRGLREAIISPGSRNAPLSIAFQRSGKFSIRVISDERSAAFVALGIAEQKNEPVALICTSGSAMINYYPAIAESYFRDVPLVVLSADRPPEAIGNWEGQTIYQEGLFGRHVLISETLDVREGQDLEFKNKIKDHLSVLEYEKGPIHLNFPFSEPFYPDPEFKISFEKEKPIVFEKPRGEDPEIPSLEGKRVLCVAGQIPGQGSPFSASLEKFQKLGIPIIGDVLANGISDITTADNWESFGSLPEPNIIITLGRSIVSKSLRNYFRSLDLLEIHLLDEHEVGNPYNSRQLCLSDVQPLMDQIQDLDNPSQKEFAASWLDKNDDAQRELLTFNFENSELGIVKALLENLPEQANIHFANSLSIRYGNLLNHFISSSVLRWANRGTNGIDGCVSTAIGHAWAEPEKEHFLIIGDQAFFYDINGLWNNKLPPNLKILLLNNEGGRIFESLPPTSQQAELDDIFVATHKRDASLICKDLGVAYNSSDGIAELSSWSGLKGQIRLFEYKSNKDLSLDIYKKVNRLI